jgi:hypothetical protein
MVMLSTQDIFSRRSVKLIPRCFLSCRKSLPKCSLCLLAMGTPVYSGNAAFEAASGGCKESAFDMWFTGHRKHVLMWFEGHEECPVSGCGYRGERK